jgi:hypothetical protein
MAAGTYVAVGADVSQVKPALDSVTKAAQQAATDVAGAFQGWTDATGKAEKAHWGLEGALKGVRTEIRDGERLTGFYVKQLASMVPVGDAAKNMLGGLAEVSLGLASSVGKAFNPLMAVLLAFDALKAGIDVYGWLNEGTKKATEEAEKLRLKTIEVAKALSQDLARSAEEARAKLDKAFGIDPEEAAMKRKVALAKINLELKRLQNDELRKKGEVEGEGQRLNDIKALEVELAKATNSYKQFIFFRDKAAAQEAGKAANKAAEGFEIEAATRRVAADAKHTQATEDQRKREQEAALEQLKATEKQIEADTKEIELKAKLVAEAEHKLNSADAASFDEGNFPGMGKKDFDSQVGIKNLSKGVKDVEATARSMGRTFSQVLGSVVTGSMTAAQAFKALGTTMVQALIDVGVQELITAIFSKGVQKAKDLSGVSGAAAVAGAEVTAQLASNPFTLAGAIPGGLAFAGAVNAAFLPMVAAASGGFDIGNYNPLTQLHAREMVLPAQLADKVRNMTDGGGRVTNLYISAVDAKSVERLFRDNDGALIKTLNRASAEGRF